VSRRRRRWIVHGRVQGVFYRQSTRERATELGVSASATNLPDGTVEVVAEGDDVALDALQAWLRQGPPRALVTKVERTS
jgi:acylphosphatase